MSSKQFVSVHFTSSKLQIVSLNKAKDEVIFFTSVDIPQGIIVDYKVKDVKALSEIIKKIWQTKNIKEKSVGLIVPEFSTFTKTIELPKVPISELDEAVRWEAQDFLPTEIKDSVIDWKVVKKSELGYQILTVAIQKGVLSGFVDAVSMAGLSPLVVETPSLSLARVSDKDSGGALVIYANLGEAILLVREGEKIVGSSVAASFNQRTVLQTVTQMISHYGETEIKKVQIGGIEIGKELYSGLSKNLKIPVEWMQPKIKAFDSKVLQEYMIPLSLQLKDPTEPADETSINLLPSEWVKSHRNKKFMKQLRSLVFASTLAILANFIVVLVVFILITSEINVLERANQNESGLKGKDKGVIKGIEDTNVLTDKVVKINSSITPPQEIINAIYSSAPQGLFVSDYKIDMEEGNILVRGNSSDRQELLTFKQNLEESGKFSKVSIPVSSFEKEKDLEFEANFGYLELSKGKKKQLKLQI